MKRTVHKLHKNKYVEIRDYDAHSCIDKKQNMVIHLLDEKMTLTHIELITMLATVSSRFKSQFPGGKSYKLHGYVWKPDKE